MPDDDLLGLFPLAGPGDWTGPQAVVLSVVIPLAAAFASPAVAAVGAVWEWWRGE